ncbi:hypothetical protein Daesc_008958 [Daldinia eschscholtzii]|uniref:CENP-V/GFA domain-containing protein n=1 Tax=Daldinia eschscholtzii TaxID=292717 RepID=A0AAX6M930_9PEZI
MDARCQCGAVSFKTPLPKPLALYICHCAECRRQTSSAFDGLDWSGAIHIWTKSAMIPIPEGSECYPEEPSESDYCTSQESLDQPLDPAGILVNSGAAPTAVDRAGTSDGINPIKGACELSGS